MSSSHPTVEEIAACKAVQERNREQRMHELYTLAGLWRRQQQSLEALAKLRPPPAAGIRALPPRRSVNDDL